MSPALDPWPMCSVDTTTNVEHCDSCGSACSGGKCATKEAATVAIRCPWEAVELGKDYSLICVAALKTQQGALGER